MSSSSTRDRGQTEPIAALVAVSTIALALSLYGVVVLDVLDQDTERELADPTVDGTWMEIRDDGVYDNISEETLVEKLEDVVNDPDAQPFPNGQSVHVELVYLADDGQMTVADNATFAWTADTPAWESVDDSEIPPHADTATRPVPIRLDCGDVQAGTLRVEVWS